MRTMKITKGLTWPFALLALATTIVYMAGLASLQRSCYDFGGFPGSQAGLSSAVTNAAFGMSTGSENCSHVFRFYWFLFAFVAVTIIGLIIAVATPLGLHVSRPFWIGMLSVSTLLMMIASEAFLGLTYRYDGNPFGQWLMRLRTAAAGAIMTVVSLILLMMAVGTDWEHRRGEHGLVEKPVSGVVGTAPVGVPAQHVRVADTV